MYALDTYRALFPHPDIGCCHAPNSDPTYESTNVAAVHINVNMASINSNGGAVKIVHLILTMGDSKYQSMNYRDVSFAVLTSSTIHPVHPTGATGPVITEANRLHK